MKWSKRAKFTDSIDWDKKIGITLSRFPFTKSVCGIYFCWNKNG